MPILTTKQFISTSPSPSPLFRMSSQLIIIKLPANSSEETEGNSANGAIEGTFQTHFLLEN